jgi:hypothetical protein
MEENVAAHANRWAGRTVTLSLSSVPLGIVGPSGEGVCFVGCSWEMYQGKVVVCQLRDVSCYSSIDVAWVAVVLKVLVVCEDHGGER